MNRKPKLRFVDLITAAVVILMFIGVPVWLFVWLMISGSWLAFVCLMVHVVICYHVCWRVENG